MLKLEHQFNWCFLQWEVKIVDLTNEIKKISNEIINLANKNNMGIKNINWLLTQIQDDIYERATINAIF